MKDRIAPNTAGNHCPAPTWASIDIDPGPAPRCGDEFTRVGFGITLKPVEYRHILRANLIDLSLDAGATSLDHPWISTQVDHFVVGPGDVVAAAAGTLEQVVIHLVATQGTVNKDPGIEFHKNRR